MDEIYIINPFIRYIYFNMGTFRKILWFTVSTLIWFSAALAANPDAFYVEVNPSSFSVWESVDMTITAITKDGTTIKDYEWDVFIFVEWLTSSDYSAPSNQVYTFIPSDQWVKLFSKGLKINKAGTYKVTVSDILDTAAWETTVIVWNASSWSAQHSINISYPSSGATESKNAINVMWGSSSLPNSPVEIYLNKSMVASGYTDSQWNFNIYISWLRSGWNEIQAKIVDVNDIILWESDVILVNYKAPSDGIFNSISISPSNAIKQWDKISISINTTEWVSSAELIFDNWKSYPMDRIAAWNFSKDITVKDAGIFNISISLVVNWTTKTYSNIADINVQENIWVYNVKFSTTWVDGTSIIMTREQLWNAPKYNILYGTQKDNLQKSVIVSSTGVLIENLQTKTKYYFQIIAMDMDSHASGSPSDIFEYNPDTVYASCVIQWVVVKSEKIWDKYYLIRDPVENAVSYQIYRSDWKDMSSKTMVWETSETRFEYYFNPDAESDQYAYYQIQATCADGSNVMIEDVEKVKVWPFENIILILIVTWFVYCIYRLYRTIDVQ